MTLGDTVFLPGNDPGNSNKDAARRLLALYAPK
jgi:hypothetical protein